MRKTRKPTATTVKFPDHRIAYVGLDRVLACEYADVFEQEGAQVETICTRISKGIVHYTVIAFDLSRKFLDEIADLRCRHLDVVR